MGRDRRLLSLRPRPDEPTVQVVDGLPPSARRPGVLVQARAALGRAVRDLRPTVRESEAAMVRWADASRGVLARLGAAVRHLSAQTSQELQSRLAARLTRAGDVMDRLRARVGAPRDAAPRDPAAPPTDSVQDRARDVIGALRARLGPPR